MRRVAFLLAWTLFAAGVYSFLQFQPLRVTLHMWSGLPGPGRAQLFWKSRAERYFDERESVRFRVVPGSGVYRLEVPASACSLRLDPLDEPGQVAIAAIELRNALGLPLAKWSAGAGLDEWAPIWQLSVSGRSPGSIVYTSTSTDPELAYERWADFIWARKWFLNLLYAVVLGLGLSWLVRWLHLRPRTAPAPAPPPPWRPRLAALAAVLVLASLGGSLAIGEAVFRLVVRRAYREELRALDGLYEPEPGQARTYTFRPSLRGAAHTFGSPDQGFSFHLNSLGFRGPEWSEPAAGRRVLVLGDSYAFGWGVGDEDPFPAQMAGLARAAGRGLEVLNAGVPGYSTPQELGALQELGERFRPDAVVLAFVMNDGQPPQPLPPDPDAVYRHAPLWSAAELKSMANLLRGPARPLFDSSKYVAGPTYLSDFRRGGPGWRTCKEAFTGMVRYCAARRVPFSVAILPDFSQPFDARYPFRPIHQELLQWARELDVPADDLWVQFASTDAAAYRVPWDTHPNRAAHRVIAEVLQRRLPP